MANRGEKVLLAYSGGLDTSCILRWLKDNGFHVIAYVANVGQNDDFDAVREKALRIGATKVIIDDLRRVFITNFFWPAVRSGLLYEGRYLLGTSLARPCISQGLVREAQNEGATMIAHGATGKGNDQVRFELSCYALYPEIKILAPWRDPKFFERFPGRPDLLNYAKINDIPVSATPAEPWSTDENLMHTSYESGILENPSSAAPKNLYRVTKDPVDSSDPPIDIEIHFARGIPSLVKESKTQKIYEDPIAIIEFLNKIGSQHGIGRIDIVENRYIGLKSRGIYECPGGKILYEAHLDLEIYMLDREVLRVKSYLAEKMADYVYNGYWFSPECDFVRESIEISQRDVTGTVYLKLYRGNVSITGRSSQVSLYNENLVSMDVRGDFSPEDAGGFIRTQAMRLKEYYRFKKQQK